MLRSFLFVIFLCSTAVTSAQEKPKKPYQLHEQAESRYNEGAFSEALVLLNDCLKINPGYMEAYPLRAGVKEQLRDLDGALTDYSIYLEQFPDHPDVLLSRAVLRFNLGFYDQARQDFRKILTLSSDETNSLFFRKDMSVDTKNPVITTTGNRHSPVVYNYLGLIEARLRNPERAIILLDSAVLLDPKEPDFYVNRGLTKESLGDSTAFIDYELALRLNPNHALALHNLEAYKSKEKQSMSEEERLTRTIGVDSTMLLPYLERAQQRFEGGYYKGALEDYNQALQMDETNVEVWFARGLTKEKLKDYDGAFSDYTKAIDLKEDYAKVWLSRGNVLLKLDRFQDAIEDYNVALIYRADYAPAFYNRAMAKVRLKQDAEACEDLKKAEELGMEVEEKVKSKICD